MSQENRESVGKCYVCKVELFRDEFAKWVYHTSIGVVCKHHHGVVDWYSGLLKETTKSLESSGIIFPESI